MGSNELFDDYDELEGALSGEGDIPGDPITGEIAEPAGEGEGDAGSEGDQGADKGDAGGEKGAEGDAKGEGEGDGEDKGEAEDDKGEIGKGKEEPDLAKENAELRSTLRDMRVEIATQKAITERLSKERAGETVYDEETGEEKPKDVEYTDLEKAQIEIGVISQERGQAFTDMVEIMSLNPKYEDVRKVCTRDRFNDVFEAAARGKVAEEGGDLLTTQLQLEAEVWRMSNPYRYMYDIIKKHHPDYKTEEEIETEKKAESNVKGTPPSDEAKERGKKLADAPVDAATLGRGGGKAMGEWTAEKIDNLDEDELTKVPKDVYDAYLRGDLDE